MTIANANLFELQSFRGKLYEGIRDSAGLVAGFRWVGNATDLKFVPEQDEVTKLESYTGLNLEIGSFIKATRAKLNFIFDTLSKGNVEMGLHSTQVSNAGAAITGETQATLAVGDYIFSKHGNISAVSVTDSLAAPLTLNTNYSIEDAIYGRFKILSLGAFTQPFKLNYTYGQEILFPIFANTALERYFRFEGINMSLSPNKPVALEFYRGKPKGFSEFGMIDDEYGKYPIETRLLADTTRAADPNFGYFGRYIPLA